MADQEQDALDAKRYRVLRDYFYSQTNLAVVSSPYRSLKLHTYVANGEHLDRLTDAAIDALARD